MEARPLRYRLFIDESGDHTYTNLGRASGRYLALLGVWFRTEDHAAFERGLEEFKHRVFGSRDGKPPVVLHRHEAVNHMGPFGALRDPAVERTFNDGLLGLISAADYRMILVNIDKLQHHFKYAEPWNPYSYALQAMLDRYCG